MELNGHSTDYTLKRSKWNNVNCLSKLSFTWLWPLYWKAFRRGDGLQFGDMFECPPQDRSTHLADQLQLKWNLEVSNNKKNDIRFYRALYRCFVWRFIPIILSFMLQELVIRTSQAWCLGNVVQYFSNRSSSIEVVFEQQLKQQQQQCDARLKATWSAVGFVVSAAIAGTLCHFNTTLTDRVGMQMKIACSTLLYCKYAYFAHSPIVAPLQLAVVTYLLWQHLEWSCLPGIAFFLLFMPIQMLSGKFSQLVRSKTAPLTDNRIRIISEIISGITLIKMYAWERAFQLVMSKARLSEICQIQNSYYLKGFQLAMYYVTSRVVLFVCFVLYVYLFGGQLDAYKVFFSMALFNTIRIPVTRHLPQSISATAELMVSCDRIQKFLLLDEVHPTTLASSPGNDQTIESETETTKVILQNSTASWDNVLPVFKNVNLSLESGDLLTIVGPVGSGKTSVLMSLMNELHLSNGELRIVGSIAYVPQKAWIFMGTIRDNILFGRDYDEAKFWNVLRVCALEKDVSLMPYREGTFVGEKGYKLSGGQKTRVNLARALYADADLYLLDDPLASLDSRIAKFIMEKCITGYLGDKIRVLITHRVHFIPEESSILILDNQGAFVRLIKPYEDKSSIFEIAGLQEHPAVPVADLVDVKQRRQTLERMKSFPMNPMVNNVEKIESDSVDRRAMFYAYKQYILAGFGWNITLIVLVSTLISQVLSQGCDYLITKWTDSFEHDKPEQRQTYLYILCAVIGTLFISTIVRAISFYSFCMKSSVNLYNRLFEKVLLSPIYFFQNNPSGRILNRFSKDIGIVDDYLPTTAFELQISVTDIVSILIIEMIVDWKFILPSLAFFALISLLSYIYLRTARQLKRLEAIARNPIFSHIQTTFDGMVNVRCYNNEKHFEQLFCKYQDFHSSVYFTYICATRGFAIIVEWICVLYIGAITLTIMLTSDLDDSFIGLSLASSILLVGVTSWAVECQADLESHMTSVERIADYQNLKSEFNINHNDSKSTNQVNSPIKVPLSLNGNIQFKDVCLSYNLKDYVLQNINFTIDQQEKIGIIGRTGAGKSSIIAALFRLIDTSGDILIDRINIKDMDLEQLRSGISSIPQDPVLFTGTIRYNLDPYGEFNDRTLWLALEEVQLKNFLISSNKNLDSKVCEGGSNFSTGQKQLICLARAMLKNNNILILDEATSNLDEETDLIIQQVIRLRFINCTVITVAHRLQTVIDCDKIMIIANGRVAEMGNPHILLSKNSLFSALVEKVGGSMEQELRITAKNVYLHKINQC